MSSDEEKEVALHLMTQSQSPVIPFEQYSDFNDLKRVTVWILRLSKNRRLSKQERCLTPSLSTKNYWISIIQNDYFGEEVQALKHECSSLKASSPLFCPILDSNNLLRVGGSDGGRQG